MAPKAAAVKNCRFQYYSDKLNHHFGYRWMAFSVLACFYAVRVYLHGYCFLTFLLGMSLSFMMFLVLSSRIDPDLDATPILPIKASDELRPFVPFLPEFDFWRIVMKILFVAFLLTFVPQLNIPAWWPVYLFGWIFFTAKVLIDHTATMIKYNYISFYYGDKKQGMYKGK